MENFISDRFNNLSIKKHICNICKKKYDKNNNNFCDICTNKLTFHFPNCNCIYCR